MKLYSLLILTKNTKKSKNNFTPKKSEIAIFPVRILSRKQNKSAIYIFPRLGRGDQGNRR